jgi:Lysyl oxidase
VPAALAAALTTAAVAAPAPAQVDDNPCLTERARFLRCPDLVMKPPHGLSVDVVTKPGRVLLRAGNSIDSVGRGPAELHGVRIKKRMMRGRQRIYRRAGGRIGVRTGARLIFKYVPGQTFYWKFFHAARFELWRLDADGRRKRLARRGPKVSYCLRDLARTRPRLARSPGRRVYPGCSTDPRERRRTLGTSVGWSDIYPPGYPEQWIDVTGLRGCFAYEHTADPRNGIYESNEDNNEAEVVVRLPYRFGKQRCPRAKRIRQGPDDPGYDGST